MPLSKLKAYFISLICESIFAGIYTFLFCVSLYLLLRHGKPRKTNIVILVLTVVMYCLSVVHLAICFQINLAALFEQKAALLENTNRGNLNISFSIFACAPIAAETLNCIIGDSIVIWRTWVLWNRNHRITYFPCTLLLGGTVAGILMVRAMYISLARETPFNSNATFAVIAFCALTTTINLYAILAIGYRVWTHSRAMKVAGSKGIGDMGGFYTRIILIFVESGFVYCAFPTLMLILFRTSSNGVFIVIGVLAQVTGIYPTAIIVLVCLQLTQHDDITRKTESAMNFQKSRTGNSGVVSTHYRSKSNVMIVEDKQETA